MQTRKQMDQSRLFVSVDVDEWYYIRWVTGSENSLWQTIEAFFHEVYNQNQPIGEILEPVDHILVLFDALDFKSTFFFTGHLASHYPDLVKKVAGAGHEIACHNFYHIDYEYETREKFRSDLIRSKSLLEDLSQQQVIGYRSPNSSIPAHLVPVLEDAGFQYDSSVTPTRRILGKFGAFTQAPSVPYRPSYDNIGNSGDANLWEFPWATLPIVKFPAGSGIMHRIGGDLYNAIATHSALSQGHSAYYFHPYEIIESPHLQRYRFVSWKSTLFCRRLGKPYLKSLTRFLQKHRNRLISGHQLLDLVQHPI